MASRKIGYALFQLYLCKINAIREWFMAESGLLFPALIDPLTPF